jgi:hypothetical protein
MLRAFTEVLTDLGFQADGISAEGLQHRWKRGDASLDVLLPDGVGERASLRRGVTGSPTLPTAGGTQALNRTEVVAVQVDGRQGHVLRPSLVGALVVKAAAHTNPGDGDARRHRRDFVVLATLVAASDFRVEQVTKNDRSRLRAIVRSIDADRELLLEIPDAVDAIDRLKLAAEIES